MKKSTAKSQPTYTLRDNGEFVITNYNNAKPLANFFPGIAGTYGIPMWVFYVNRGQAINCFGIDGKDTAILEFQPANKAWQQTSLLGFRTFIKVRKAGKTVFYEPFHDGFANQSFDITNTMSMSSHELDLEETNRTLGLKTQVEYFTIPQDSFAALARIVTITNTGKKPLSIQALDGLPRIVPYGIANLFLKKLSRTIEAWMRVENLENQVPFYKIDVDPIDRPQVIHIARGNFFLGFEHQKKKAKIIKPIVDPEPIFGPISDFSYPRSFLKAGEFAYPTHQQTSCKTPCGFLLVDWTLAPGESRTLYEVIGNTHTIDVLDETVRKITRAGYLQEKRAQNEQIIHALQATVETKSSSWELDYYCKQSYLDNVMRGGYPLVFSSQGRTMIYYLYSRKHGDLERDYNKFQIQPTYLSQGNGNYRDMNQNRRCDNWFEPRIKDFNCITFLNLLQTDSYNPLVVKGATFTLYEVEDFKKSCRSALSAEDLEPILELVTKKFTPGQVIHLIEEKKLRLAIGYDEFLNLLIPCCAKNPEAEFGEGFWIDHWHYNIDLLENYLSIYPENLRELIFEKKVLTYYDSEAVVQPRSAKYVLLDGIPKQLHAVTHDDEKRKLISQRKTLPHIVRSGYGTGDILRATVVEKLLCVFANRLASLDPFGMGVEMEADKPNWFDSLNGLPALFGSSTCETFELKRLALFLLRCLEHAPGDDIILHDEIKDFLQALSKLVDEYNGSADDTRDLCYWDSSATLKEAYRARTKLGLSGAESGIARDELIRILTRAVAKIDAGLKRARSKDMYCSYYINEVCEYDKDGSTIKPKSFTQKPVVLFLEGQMHALRLCETAQQAQALYQATRSSALFDKKLKMYKVTAALASMPEEIGRCRAFTPGWLENESIWLHMEYKYLLEMLKHGLYEEFYGDFKNALIPFQKPEVYGRSILENSSFLVSSAFPYRDLHGNGFVARLSGSTIEFLQIWLTMNLGIAPFFLDKGKLSMKIAPILAGWLFTVGEKTYSFTALGGTRFIYHNPKRKNTFGKDGASVKRISLTDRSGAHSSWDSDTIPHEHALRLRSGQIAQVDVFF